MSKKDMVEIAFPYGGIIPAKVLGEAKDVKLDPHAPRNVPKAYAEHLIADRIAYDYKAHQEQQKLAEERKEVALQCAQDQADKQTDIDKLQADLTELTSERDKLADALSTMRGELDELKAKNATLASELEASKAATKHDNLQIGNESEKTK